MVQRLNRAVENLTNKKRKVKASDYLSMTDEELNKILQNPKQTRELILFLVRAIDNLSSDGK